MSPSISDRARQAGEELDAHTRDIVQWHFGADTGSRFWLEKKNELDFDPLTDISPEQFMITALVFEWIKWLLTALLNFSGELDHLVNGLSTRQSHDEFFDVLVQFLLSFLTPSFGHHLNHHRNHDILPISSDQ